VPKVKAECFSGESTVLVAGKGRVALRSVQIGDQVQVENGTFEPVYSFGHYDSNSYGSFLQLHLSNGRNLVVSHDHLIFTAADAHYPIPASKITIGTKLVDVDRRIFAPFTPSGTVVVDGVLSSSFVAVEASSLSSPFVVLFGGLLRLSHQWMSHSFEFPHRVACYYFKFNSNNDAMSKQGNSSKYTRYNYCPTETYTNGVATWFITPLKLLEWFGQQNPMVRGVLLGMLAILFSLFQLVEVFLVFYSSNPAVWGVMKMTILLLSSASFLVWLRKQTFVQLSCIPKREVVGKKEL
jgi:Hint module